MLSDDKDVGSALFNAPLVVDLDGTLTPSDTLVESAVLLVRQRPWLLFALLWWLLQGRAGFKDKVAEACRLPVVHLPWRADLLDWIHSQRTLGRKVVLATAAHRQIADDVSRALPLFDAVLSSDRDNNLKGTAKLAAIQREIGPRFTYAGDSAADLPIWAAAQSAVLVGATPSVVRQVRASPVHIEREFQLQESGGWSRLRTWLKAIRIHQWVKNALLFVPLLTSFSFTDPTRLGAAFLAFCAFCVAASGTYLLNDVWDLENDRQHPRKKERPLASGRLPLHYGVVAAFALLLAGLGLAAIVSWQFAVMLAGYICLTTTYSWVLKAYVLADVIALALLYAYRVLAGAVAINVVLSPWLLAFSVFTFLSLALVKRCSELVSLSQAGKPATRGRDYRVTDLVVLWPLGVGAGLCAVLVFCLFIGSPEARGTYGESPALWLVGVGLTYWLARMWIKTARGEMHDDPIVFALKDRGSLVVIAAMGALPVAAHFVR
jgi:4-hydroxybenzoate polyprenyltransferase/phosphoserine phosphatase